MHLLGTVEKPTEESLFLLGTDNNGRDLFSRLVIASRVSLSIGLIGVVLGLILGIVLGGISGFYGGVVDSAIQRLIEILRSIPTIPLWMTLAAALPHGWSVVQRYLAITVILSFFAWTTLAREVRGRFLALREEDFVLASEVLGATRKRVILRHMVPAMTSHIIATATLAIPGMILAETGLSFLGLGLRPPAHKLGRDAAGHPEPARDRPVAVADDRGLARDRVGAGLQLRGRRAARRRRPVQHLSRWIRDG